MARGRTSGRGNRLAKTWSRFGFSGVAVSGAQSILGSVTFTTGSGLEATILRSRGQCLLACTPNAVADVEVIGLGIIVVSESAFAAGAASLPGPIADISSDSWLYHSLHGFDAVAATAGDGQSITLNERVEIDSKAMRRLPEGNVVVFMAEALVGSMVDVAATGGLAILLGT